MRWNKRYDGSKESLIDKSHRPNTTHPNSHTEEELKWIRNYIRRNPSITLSELWVKLKDNKGFNDNQIQEIVHTYEQVYDSSWEVIKDVT